MSENTDPIPVFQPHIGDDTLKAVADAFDIGWLGMGATTRAFEDAIAEWIGVGERRVIATNTGTSALRRAAASMVRAASPANNALARATCRSRAPPATVSSSSAANNSSSVCA